MNGYRLYGYDFTPEMDNEPRPARRPRRLPAGKPKPAPLRLRCLQPRKRLRAGRLEPSSRGCAPNWPTGGVKSNRSQAVEELLDHLNKLQERINNIWVRL